MGGVLLRKRAWRASGVVGAFLWVSLVAGCSSTWAPSGPPQVVNEAEVQASIRAEVQQRVASERADRLARQVERLQTDLRQAEEALVMAESGLVGSHSRARAVSSLAEARIQVEGAGRAAPWRRDDIAAARAKLDEANRQIEERHFGAALFFVYRAERIAKALEAEAKQVHATPGARFVRVRRANLRGGPSLSEDVLTVVERGTPVFPESHRRDWILVRTTSDRVGWIHVDLLADQAPSPPASPSSTTTQSRPSALAR